MLRTANGKIGSQFYLDQRWRACFILFFSLNYHTTAKDCIKVFESNGEASLAMTNVKDLTYR